MRGDRRPRVECSIHTTWPPTPICRSRSVPRGVPRRPEGFQTCKSIRFPTRLASRLDTATTLFPSELMAIRSALNLRDPRSARA
jgi:hypothetical protein